MEKPTEQQRFEKVPEKGSAPISDGFVDVCNPSRETSSEDQTSLPGGAESMAEQFETARTFASHAESSNLPDGRLVRECACHHALSRCQTCGRHGGTQVTVRSKSCSPVRQRRSLTSFKRSSLELEIADEIRLLRNDMHIFTAGLLQQQNQRADCPGFNQQQQQRQPQSGPLQHRNQIARPVRHPLPCNDGSPPFLELPHGTQEYQNNLSPGAEVNEEEGLLPRSPETYLKQTRSNSDTSDANDRVETENQKIDPARAGPRPSNFHCCCCRYSDCDHQDDACYASTAAMVAAVEECTAGLERVSHRVNEMHAQLERHIRACETNIARSTTRESRSRSNNARNETITRDELFEMVQETVETNLRANVGMQFLWLAEQLRDRDSRMEAVQTANAENIQQIMRRLEGLEEALHYGQRRSNEEGPSDQENWAAMGAALARSEQCVRTLGAKLDERFTSFQMQHNITADALLDRLNTGVTNPLHITVRETQNINQRLDGLVLNQRGLNRQLETAMTNFDHVAQTMKQEASLLAEHGHAVNTKLLKNGLSALASRLYHAKNDLFTALDKESQLLRDALNEKIPTRDTNQLLTSHVREFDFYIDNFGARLQAATKITEEGAEDMKRTEEKEETRAAGQQNVPDQTGDSGQFLVFPDVDTQLASYKWYVAAPVNTSIQGHVKFDRDGNLQVYVAPASIPFEVGLSLRNDMLVNCQVVVIDRSSPDMHRSMFVRAQEENAMGNRFFYLLATDFRGSEKRLIGTVSCSHLISKGLVSDDSILLRYKVAFSSRQFQGGVV